MLRATRNAVRFLAIAVSVAAVAATLSCATAIQVAYDEQEDLSRYRTWAWESDVDARAFASRSSHSPLVTLLTRQIGQRLQDRGYEHTPTGADLWVRYQISMRRMLVAVEVPRAPYLLSSLSSSPSYWIEGTDTERRLMRDLWILIEVSDPDGRLVWKGAARRRVEDGQKLDVEDLVASVLGRFPARSRSGEAADLR